MPNSILYLSQLLLPPTSLALGDLVTNRTHPWQGSTLRYSKTWALNTDIKVKYHTISDIFTHIIPIGIDAHANNLFGLIISSGKENVDVLDASQAKCLKLLDPEVKFEELYLKDEKIRGWIEERSKGKHGQGGEDVYMVTGLYSLSNAQVTSLVKRIGGRTGVPIKVEGKDGEEEVERKGNAMVHHDEQIFGIKYRKVSLEV